MKSIFALVLFLLLPLAARALPVVVDPATPMAGTFAVEWQTADNFESWTTSQVSSATVVGGVLSGVSSGTNPQVNRANFDFGCDLDLGFNDFLEIRIQVPASYAGNIQIFYGTTGNPGISASRVLTIPSAVIPKDGAFHTYRIDVGPEPWWRNNLIDLRIVPVSTSGQAFAIDYLRVGDLPGDVYLPNTNNWGATTYELSSKHFRFIWDANRQTNSGINATQAHGILRNAEEAWQVYAKVMGYREPAESTYSPNGNKYKVNFLCIYNGYYMNSTWDGFAFLNIEPSGLQVDLPTWIIPHELMHVFQYHNNNGNYSGQWETHANYGRARWLKHYQNLYPNKAGIEALGVRDGHFMISSGRNYYLTWPFLYYVDDNPDNLSDLSDGMIKRLWQEGLPGEFWPATLDRLTPTTSLKDISGYYARRCATWDFSNQAAMTAELNNQDPTRNARHLFTDLIQRPDAPGWWRVPPNKAPAQGAYAMHELIPTGSGAGRVVTVNLQGLADSARGADWRASFIAVSDTGVERYTPLWNNGSSSITLAADENKLYLSVAGTPDWYANGGFNEPSEPFRSHPSRSRFHYQVEVTGATPRERDNGSTTGLTKHANGGGYRSVSVPSSVFIGPNARVTGGSVSGNARIEDYAVVSGGTVNSSSVMSGHAWVRGGTVTGNARVRDWAIVDSGTISGNARILEHATVEGSMQDSAVAKGSAWHQSGGTLSGNAIVDGDYMGNKSLSGGITFGHMPFVGIPDNFTTNTPVGHFVSYDFGTYHESRALDQYGVTDGFTIGSPPWSYTDGYRRSILSFNGTDQYLVLDRSVADTRAFTFAAWVKPLGGTANQAVLWLGASTARRLAFTPDDGTGHAKFSIANGGADQVLTAPAALPASIWTHVAITLDGTTGTLFVNGTSVASAPITIMPDMLLAANTTTAAQHNYLCRAEGAAMPMFQGSLDDVQFFTSALTQAQIQAVNLPTGNLLTARLALSDSFDSTSNGAGSFNTTLAADQQGALAPITYKVTTAGQDWQAQHGNDGTMLLAGDNGYGAKASLNENLASLANFLNAPVRIDFDGWVSDTTAPGCWFSFAVGSAQNILGYEKAAKFGILPKVSGEMEVWTSGVAAPNTSHSGNSYRVIISNTAGTGSAFNGNGSMVKLYNGATLVNTYTLGQLGAGDGFLSFGANPFNGSWNLAHIDNLRISMNRPPLAVNDGSLAAPVLSVEYASGSSVPVAVLANDTDPDGDPFTVAAYSSPNGTVSLNRDGTLVFTPAPDFHGQATISYALSDGQDSSAQATVFLTVTVPPPGNGTWTNAAGGNWSLADNWQSFTVGGGTDKSATFNLSGPVAVTLDTPITLGSLVFSGANHTLSGSGVLTLDASSGTPTISVEAGRTATIGIAVSGVDGFAKTGAGTLTLAGANTYTGTTLISGGTLKLAPVPLAPVPGMARWFDASALGVSNGAGVSQWNDVSGNNAHATVPGGNGTPTYIADAGTGTGMGALNFTAGNNASDSQAYQFARDGNIRSVVSIFKGSSFLLTDSSVWDYDFHRPSNTNAADPLWGYFTSATVTGGSTYVNGTAVNGTSDAMPTNLHNGYNLVEVFTTGNVAADSFNKDRGNLHSGNQSHGEVLIYDFVLTEEQRLTNERYLNYKWFGIGTGGPVLPTTTAVKLSNGGILDLGGIQQTVGELWVNGIQMSAGVYSSSNSAFLAGVGNLTVTGGSSYANWSGPGGYNLAGGPGEDDDADGIANVLEYVLGSNPSQNTPPAILPTGETTGGNFVFRFRRVASTTADTTQVFQYGTDLAAWTDVPLVNGGMVSIQPTTPQAGVETVTVTVPVGSSQRIFGRIKAALP